MLVADGATQDPRKLGLYRTARQQFKVLIQYGWSLRFRLTFSENGPFSLCYSVFGWAPASCMGGSPGSEPREKEHVVRVGSSHIRAPSRNQTGRLPFWVETKAHKSERRTRLSRARRPMSITARHPSDLAIAQAARGWPCPSLLHRRRTRTPHARARSHLVQVSRRWRQARWMVRAPQVVCEAQRVCQTNTRTQYMPLSARIAFKP